MEHPHITWHGPTAEHPARTACFRSFVCVAERDLEGWLQVYAEDAVVQDPVGPSMFDPAGEGHHGHAGLRAFWDTAIAPVAEFRFVVHDAHANPGSAEHAAVATITTRFEDGTVVDTDLVTVHEVDDEGRISRMRAYWNPERAMGTARQE